MYWNYFDDQLFFFKEQWKKHSLVLTLRIVCEVNIFRFLIWHHHPKLKEKVIIWEILDYCNNTKPKNSSDAISITPIFRFKRFLSWCLCGHLFFSNIAIELNFELFCLESSVYKDLCYGKEPSLLSAGWSIWGLFAVYSWSVHFTFILHAYSNCYCSFWYINTYFLTLEQH